MVGMMRQVVESKDLLMRCTCIVRPQTSRRQENREAIRYRRVLAELQLYIVVDKTLVNDLTPASADESVVGGDRTEGNVVSATLSSSILKQRRYSLVVVLIWHHTKAQLLPA